MDFFIRLGKHVNRDERMRPIDFGGQRSKVKVTMDIYGNKLVNAIESTPLHISLSDLANMLTVMRGCTLLILEVIGQRSRSVRLSVRGPCERQGSKFMLANSQNAS